MKVCCAVLEETVELLPLAGLSRLHGMATCFVPPAVELEMAEVGDEVPVLPEVEALVSLELLVPLSESTAKSTLPEVGLMTISLIVPIVSPVEDFTSALVN